MLKYKNKWAYLLFITNVDISLIYQTNQKNQRYDKTTINRKRNFKKIHY
jgi:hypothetical protein